MHLLVCVFIVIIWHWHIFWRISSVIGNAIQKMFEMRIRDWTGYGFDAIVLKSSLEPLTSVQTVHYVCLLNIGHTKSHLPVVGRFLSLPSSSCLVISYNIFKRQGQYVQRILICNKRKVFVWMLTYTLSCQKYESAICSFRASVIYQLLFIWAN